MKSIKYLFIFCLFQLSLVSCGEKLIAPDLHGKLVVDALEYKIDKDISPTDTASFFAEYKISCHFEIFPGTVEFVYFQTDADRMGVGTSDYKIISPWQNITYTNKLWIIKNLKTGELIKTVLIINGYYRGPGSTTETFHWRHESVLTVK